MDLSPLHVALRAGVCLNIRVVNILVLDLRYQQEVSKLESESEVGVRLKCFPNILFPTFNCRTSQHTNLLNNDMRWSMKRCWISRGSATIGWFRNSKRYYVKTRRPGSFPHAKLGAGIPDIALPEGIEPFDKGETQDGAHGEDTGAEELDGRSASNTCRDALPMSPLMDPSFFEGREKHHKPKAPPSQEPTPFQQQLAKNPYGMKLPVRHFYPSVDILQLWPSQHPSATALLRTKSYPDSSLTTTLYFLILRPASLAGSRAASLDSMLTAMMRRLKL